MDYVAKVAINSKVNEVKDAFGLGEKGIPTKGDTYINWNDRNYPPLFKRMHFDRRMDPMPTLAFNGAWWLHNGYRLLLATYIINLIDSIILATGGASSALNILYSVIHLILGSIYATFVFFNGYKGIAGDMKIYRNRYCVVNGVYTIFMLVFVFLNAGNIHGWTAIGASTSMTGYFDFVCALESILWTINFLIAVYSIYTSYQYFGHGSWTPDMSKKYKGKQKVKNKSKDPEKGESKSSTDESTPDPDQPTTKKSGFSLFK